MVTAAWNQNTVVSWQVRDDKSRQPVEKQRHYSADKGPCNQGKSSQWSHMAEKWTAKKTECQRTEAFKLWCWKRLLKVPCTGRRSNKSILGKSTLNIRWKNWCWSWSSSILVNWCKQLTHWTSPWFWERLRAEGEEGVEDEMARCNGHELMAGCNGYRCNGHELGQSLGDGEGQEGLACCSPCGCRVTWEGNWTEQLFEEDSLFSKCDRIVGYWYVKKKKKNFNPYLTPHIKSISKQTTM